MPCQALNYSIVEIIKQGYRSDSVGNRRVVSLCEGIPATDTELTEQPTHNTLVSERGIDNISYRN